MEVETISSTKNFKKVFPKRCSFEFSVTMTVNRKPDYKIEIHSSPENKMQKESEEEDKKSKS